MTRIKKKLFSLFWKIIVWLDYIIRYKEFPESIELTSNKNIIKLNGKVCAFYLKSFYHHEICD